MKTTRHLTPALALAAAVAGLSVAEDTRAADHNDPIELEPSPGNSVDPAADLADIFAWNDGVGDRALVNLALTWRSDPLYERQFDKTIQLSIHIVVDDTSPLERLPRLDKLRDLTTSLKNQVRKTPDTHTIRIAFGEKKGSARDAQGGPSEWGVRIDGLPGHGRVVGPVGEVFEPTPRDSSRRHVKVLAGVFDDAFFADKDGFFNAISTTLGNTKLQPDCVTRVRRGAGLDRPIPGKVTGGGEAECSNPTSSWPNYPLLRDTPFGLNHRLDGFGLANMHGIVIQVPVEMLGAGSGSQHRKIHVWASTEGKVGRKRSGHTFSGEALQ